MNNILLTGSTGVAGSEILKTLMTIDDIHIFLLIRFKDNKALKLKLQKLQAYLSHPIKDDKITVIKGDISTHNLGISNEFLGGLVQDLTIIIHAAANINLGQSLEEARRNALTGTTNVLELAGKCPNLKRVVYISSVGVNGKSTALLQEELPPPNTDFHNNYEQAKSEAEWYIYKNWYKKLPIIIIRPSAIVGHSQTGIMLGKQGFYYACMYLTKGVPRGFSPKINNFQLDTVPVDYLANFIVKVAFDNDLTRGVFNVCTGYENAIYLTEMRDMLHSISIEEGQHHKITYIPLTLYKMLLRLIYWISPKKKKKTIRLAEIFIQYLATPPRFSNEVYKNQVIKYHLEQQNPDLYLMRVLKNIERNEF